MRINTITSRGCHQPCFIAFRENRFDLLYRTEICRQHLHLTYAFRLASYEVRTCNEHADALPVTPEPFMT